MRLGPTLALAAAVAAPALAVYGFAASRDLGWVDSVELALAGATLGIPHPTGYPLYVLLARLAAAVAAATRLEPAFAVNFLSAVAAAAACGVVALAGRRLGLRPAAAAAGALALAFSRELLAQATVAEVYTLHLLIVALLLLAALTHGERPSTRLLLIIAYLFGLGLAHHLTVLLVAPALVILVAAARPSPRLAMAVAVAAAVLLVLPLTLYAVLLLRSRADPVLDQGDPETLPRLIAHLSGRQFRYRLFTSEPGYVIAEIRRFLRLIADQWTPAFLPLAGVGGVALARRPGGRRTLAALLVLAAAVVAHAVEYRIPDKGGYYLPAYLVVALLFAAGVDLLFEVARGRPALKVLAAAACAALLLVPALAHVRAADRHTDRSLGDLAREVERRVPPGSLVVSDDTSLGFALLYLVETGEGAPDRRIVAQYLLPLPWYAARLEGIDAGLPAAAAAAEAARRGLSGRALGDRLAADARRLAADLARRASAQHPVFFYFHGFEEDRRSFEGLELADRGLVYEVVTAPRGGAAPAPIPDTSFERLAAYEGGGGARPRSVRWPAATPPPPTVAASPAPPAATSPGRRPSSGGRSRSTRATPRPGSTSGSSPPTTSAARRSRSRPGAAISSSRRARPKRRPRRRRCGRGWSGSKRPRGAHARLPPPSTAPAGAPRLPPRHPRRRRS